MDKPVADRIERGFDLAHDQEDFDVDPISGYYRVPASKGDPYYVDADTGHCTCPDRQQGQAHKLDLFCKHFYAVRFVLMRPTSEMKEWLHDRASLHQNV